MNFTSRRKRNKDGGLEEWKKRKDKEKKKKRTIAPTVARFKKNLCQLINKYIIANLTQNRKR